MTFRYKTATAGTWEDVPLVAQGDAGTEGGLQLVYPPAPDRDGNGLPCGAVGRPAIVFNAGAMRGDGVQFWQDLFGSETAESVQLWLTVWNPRLSAWERRVGYLVRPTCEGVQPANSPAGTLYSGVTITVVETTAAT